MFPFCERECERSFFYSIHRNTGLWSSMPSPHCPQRSATILECVWSQFPEPHLLADILVWTQFISISRENPDAQDQGYYLLTPGCSVHCLGTMRWTLAVRSFAGRESPWHSGNPYPILHHDNCLLPKQKSSLHGKYKNACDSSVPSRSHNLISYCYDTLFSPKKWRCSWCKNYKFRLNCFQPLKIVKSYCQIFRMKCFIYLFIYI